jgi:hypothetical protein
VYDASSPAELRVAAYHALFKIRGMPFEVARRVRLPEFRFPENVDWAFVDSFIS